MITHEELSDIELFNGIDTEVIGWLADKGKVSTYYKGSRIYEAGDAIDHLTIVLHGQINFQMDVGGQLINISSYTRGGITGLLPYSNLKQSIGFATAGEDSSVLELHKEHFHELEQKSPELVARLVDVMKFRVRESVRQEQQREKMAALGKLSAGLAHELNNPASAIQRFSAELHRYTQLIGEQTQELVRSNVDSDTLQKAIELIDTVVARSPKSLSLSDINTKTDHFEDWFSEHELEECEDICDNLIDSNVELDDLKIFDELSLEQLPPLMRWLDNVLSVQRMNMDIQEAGKRISNLVSSIKSYSHMDRGNSRESVHLKEGINNTLTILHHKIRDKNIAVSLDFEDNLPLTPVYVGEINQVWTNILDNAIDAVEQDGQITIRAGKEDGLVRISFTDNGPGIPEDIQSRIFDPFFTTKQVGIGTGLGLDIVKRILKNHQGDIKLYSKPGETTFQILLPLEDNG